MTNWYLREFLMRMENSLKVVKYARMKEPENDDYIWIEEKLNLWIGDLKNHLSVTKVTEDE